MLIGSVNDSLARSADHHNAFLITQRTLLRILQMYPNYKFVALNDLRLSSKED